MLCKKRSYTANPTAPKEKQQQTERYSPSHIRYEFIALRLHGDKRPRAEQSEQQKRDIDNYAEENAVPHRSLGFLRVSLAERLRKQRVDAYARAHPDCDYEQLHGKGERKGEIAFNAVFAHVYKESGVHDIVDGLQYHGNYHGQSHFPYEPAYGLRRHFICFFFFH